ncbi:hypothetical protein SAMN05444505_11625 [Pseudomonas syringae]|uniref:Uncharacterized protein n=1 Tax=Pseudomonas syringae TaxID=317 RepID=A0AB37ZUM0_PSESX|nr:hypothetical protein SAMN05444505_11625 [Pseudomonas syringae]
MRIISEITHPEAMASFLACPRFALGATIFFAGTMLLLIEALNTIYR